MALKGIDVFKLSPKLNCRECGFSTCMAFCMKVAQGDMSLEKCPYFSADAVEKLQRQAMPPMATVKAGPHSLGGETVLYRHEKTLVHKNLFAVAVCTRAPREKAEEKLRKLQSIDYTRIGERMQVECVFVRSHGGDEARFAELAGQAAATGRCVILHCREVSCAAAALEAVGSSAVLDAATPDNWEEMNDLARKYGVPLGVWAPDIQQLYETVRKLEQKGNKDLLLDVTADTAAKTLRNAVLVRRAALKGGDRTFGYPSIVNIAELAHGDIRLQTAYAAMFIQRYGSVLVMQDMDYAQALPLYGLRQNIFTDPQKPMKVESAIYPLNGADENSPCAITVDFALTYFLVRGELERSNEKVNLIICDAAGMSVLTAWAAGKLSAESVKKTLENLAVERKIRSRTLIIPGKVAVMRRQIQQALPGWTVVAGPGEAVQLPQYMKEKAYLTAAHAAEQEAAAAQKEQSGECTFQELLERLPPIHHEDLGVHYRGRAPGSRAFTVIGERIHCISPVIRRAMNERDPGPILKRAAEQIAAGATYLDVNIGPAASDGPERMMWAVKLLQENFDSVPLVLDTANQKAIEAGIRVYDRTHGKPVVNSADAGSRRCFLDLAAANDAVCIALCSADGIARDVGERMKFCHELLERGLHLGMASDDLWFDPLFLVVKGMQDKQADVLETLRLLSQEGLKSTGGVSNVSNGAPRAVRPVMDSAMMAMAMMQGMTCAIVNPCDSRMMETIRSCDVILNRVVYSDSYLEL